MNFSANGAPASKPWLRLVVLVACVILAVHPVHSEQNGARSTSVHRCNLSRIEINSLIGLLEDIGREPTDDDSEAESGEETVDEGEDSTPTNRYCARQLDQLRNSIASLKKSYLALKQNVNQRKYKESKIFYDQQKKTLTDQLTQLTKQMSQQRGGLVRKIAEMKQLLNESVANLEQQRQQSISQYIPVVANSIRRGKLQQALTNFEQLMRYAVDPYQPIVEKVYVDNDGASAMLDFLQQVDFTYQPVAGYKALLDAMITKKALQGPDGVELLMHIQAIILSRDGAQHRQALELLDTLKMNAA